MTRTASKSEMKKWMSRKIEENLQKDFQQGLGTFHLFSEGGEKGPIPENENISIFAPLTLRFRIRYLRHEKILVCKCNGQKSKATFAFGCVA